MPLLEFQFAVVPAWGMNDCFEHEVRWSGRGQAGGLEEGRSEICPYGFMLCGAGYAGMNDGYTSLPGTLRSSRILAGGLHKVSRAGNAAF